MGGRCRGGLDIGLPAALLVYVGGAHVCYQITIK